MSGATPDQMLTAETRGLDIRFHWVAVDASELPSNCKPAATVMRQIDEYGLADVVDCIHPYGCIMAGDLPPASQKGKRMRRKDRRTEQCAWSPSANDTDVVGLWRDS